MRLFIALNFGDPFVDVLENLQEDLRSAGAVGNFTKRENLHMTLAFIGEYGNIEPVIDAMAQAGFKPLDIRLDGVQQFREMYFARIAENQGLDAYARRLRRSLSDGGIPFDRKKFSPHITLIRKAEYLNGLPEIGAPDACCRVESVSLMRSERGKNGMIYTEIGSVG